MVPSENECDIPAPDPCILSEIARFYPFLLGPNIPLYVCTTPSLSIHLSMENGLLPYIGYCKSSCSEHWSADIFSFQKYKFYKTAPNSRQLCNLVVAVVEAVVLEVVVAMVPVSSSPSSSCGSEFFRPTMEPPLLGYDLSEPELG